MALLPSDSAVVPRQCAAVSIGWLTASNKSVSTLPCYCYTKLEQGYFRVLVLQPGPFDVPISCSLQPVNLLDFDDVTGRAKTHELGSYEAVSYVWSAPVINVNIECDGAKLCITKSLEDVLRRFRNVTDTRTIWADGVCINQTDAEEREQQVSLMGLIYWKAQRCLIWLGHDDESEEQWSASHAARLVQTLGTIYRDSDEVSPAAINWEMTSIEDFGFNGANCWEALRRLLIRKWFYRVWVVQELGLSRQSTFFCGAVSFDGNDLNDTVSLLIKRAPAIFIVYELNLQMLRLSRAYINSTRGGFRFELGNDPASAENFLEILELARGLLCTDARDAVYAFLGHPSAFKQHLLDVEPYMQYSDNFYQGKPTIIEPDYDEETGYLDVYLRVSYAALHNVELGLQLLSHVTHDEWTIHDGYPSWMPRWNINEFCKYSPAKQALYSASGPLPPAPVMTNIGSDVSDPMALPLKALMLARVCFVRELPGASHFAIFQPGETVWGESLPNPVEELCTCLEGWHPLFTNPLLGTTIDLACTLTAGMSRISADSVETLVENDPHHFQKFNTYRRVKALSGQSKDGLRDGDVAVADDYMTGLNEVAARQAFIATREGRIGLGPRITEVGDEIWLPIGAHMPFVLRPLGEKNFKILGLAYLHGMMHGEAVAGHAEVDFEDILLI
jgi:hypothetical protein